VWLQQRAGTGARAKRQATGPRNLYYHCSRMLNIPPQQLGVEPRGGGGVTGGAA